MEQATQQPITLPGVWSTAETCLYVKEYNDGQAFIEARIGEGKIVFQAKVVGTLGGILRAATQVGEAHVTAFSRELIEKAVNALEFVLAYHLRTMTGLDGDDNEREIVSPGAVH